MGCPRHPYQTPCPCEEEMYQMQRERRRQDAENLGSIIADRDWATHIHQSNDPLNPWFSITDQRTGKKLAQGLGSTNDYIDSLLPSFMKKNDPEW